MVQQIGETRDAIIGDDEKRIQDIIYANKDRKDKYWIVVFAKPSKNTIDNKPILTKHIKPYGVKPRSMVGMIIGEVDNSTGTISWEVNMPQAPFDHDQLQIYGVERTNDIITETTSIPNAYITQ
jgi:hypothetical protein